MRVSATGSEPMLYTWFQHARVALQSSDLTGFGLAQLIEHMFVI